MAKLHKRSHSQSMVFLHHAWNEEWSLKFPPCLDIIRVYWRMPFLLCFKGSEKSRATNDNKLLIIIKLKSLIL